MRGEKQAGQRAAVAGVVQAVAAERGHHGISRSQTPPSAARARSISRRIDALLLREGDQQRLVAGEMVEHAGEEVRIAGGIADVARADAGGGEKAAEMLGLGGEERQRRDGERLRRLAPRAVLAAADFAAVHGMPIWLCSSLAIPQLPFRKRAHRTRFNRLIGRRRPCGARVSEFIACHGVNTCGRRYWRVRFLSVTLPH